MIRSNALLAGLAGAFLISAPALAQDAAPQESSPPTASAQPSSLTLTPGSSVKSKDGTELGKLVGVQAGASGQELTVRGADGQVRPVPVNGIEASGSDILVDATLANFQSAAPIASEATTPTDAPEPTDATDQVAPTPEPAEPSEGPDA